MQMIEINLLPKEFRKKTSSLSLGKKEYYALGAVVGVIIMIAVISLLQSFQIAELDKKMAIAKSRTQQLKKDIAYVDALIDIKGKIVKRMEAIDRLDQHRTVWVRIMEDVSRRVPEFMWLSSITESSAKRVPGDTTAVSVAQPTTNPIEIRGFAFNLSSLANFMIKLMRSDFFTDVEVASVEEMQFKEIKAYSYKMTATLHYLSDDELKKLLEEESGPKLLAGF